MWQRIAEEPAAQHNVPNARKHTGQTDAGMLALYTSRYMRAQASFFFHCRMCLRKLSAPLPCKSLLEPVCRSTCKADLSSHLVCLRLSRCCFLTCKLLACPRSMQVYRYSSQNQLNSPNAKNCKEPCTPSDLTKRTVTSRCGNVASAFSIIEVKQKSNFRPKTGSLAKS